VDKKEEVPDPDLKIKMSDPDLCDQIITDPGGSGLRSGRIWFQIRNTVFNTTDCETPKPSMSFVISG